MAFTCPVALFTVTYQRDMQRTWSFSPIAVLAYTFLYMAIHDVYFYMIHSTFHSKRILYNHFHAMHHEYVYAMNVYCVGYAEVAENFLQVGVPWVVWTWIAGSNWFNWILPLSLVLFTTLVGHSGYRMSPLIAIFHPLVLPVVALTGRHMLTPGDHQVHHTHRRYNYGLFWRGMDKQFGTYRKCEVKAYDVTFWRKWHDAQQADSEEGRKWLGRHNTEFSEVEWGF
jgi:sterol desaturase/sphingolipid hydroxylase (fatty acid hydroxylase superfamily)